MPYRSTCLTELMGTLQATAELESRAPVLAAVVPELPL